MLKFIHTEKLGITSLFFFEYQDIIFLMHVLVDIIIWRSRISYGVIAKRLKEVYKFELFAVG